MAEETEGRSAEVAGPSGAPRVGVRKRGREACPDADSRLGVTKRLRTDMEQHRAAVEAERAAALSTYLLLTGSIAELDVKIARLEKELE
jgi:hypothetical protein